MKQLDRLLYLQGGSCFFCKKALPKAEASVEHLVASANGGENSEDNCVVCCKSLNALLGSRPLKEKIGVFLGQKGEFRCPVDIGQTKPLPVSVPKPQQPSQAKVTLAPPQKQNSTKQVLPLATTPKQPLKPPAGMTPPARTVDCPNCNRPISAIAGQSAFVCQGCGNLFHH